MSLFEEKIDIALKLTAEDNPKPVELEGTKKKSADGAHRFLNKPTEHTEYEPEADEFENNPHKHSDQARPGLD